MRYGWIVLCLVFFALAILAMSAVSAVEPQRVTNDFSRESNLKISDKYIVWEQDGQIFYYDIATKQTRLATTLTGTNNIEDLQFDKLVFRNQWSNLFYKNLTTGGSEVMIITSMGSMSPASVYGDYIVFSNTSWDAGFTTVYFNYYDVQAMKVYTLSSKPVQSFDIRGTDVFRDRALFIYQENEKYYMYQQTLPSGTSSTLNLPYGTGSCSYAGTNGDIAICKSYSGMFKFDLKFGTVEPIPALNSILMGESDLSVHGSSLLFLNFTFDQGFAYDLFHYRIDSQQVTRLTYDSGMEAYFAICNEKIVFESNKDGQFDVYFFIMPTTPPDLVVRESDVLVKPAVGILDDKFIITAKVSNKGLVKASGTVTVYVKDPSGIVKKNAKNFVDLAPATDITMNLDMQTISTMGYLSVDVVVRQVLDSSAIQEIDLSNNRATVSFFVTDRPVAVIDYTPMNLVPISNEPVVCSGLGSTDREGIMLYVWDFGDGTSAVGSEPTHIWTTSGTFNVNLTVYDVYGVSGSVIKAITIEDQPPVFVYSVPLEVPRNVKMIYSAAGSFDPDGKNLWIYWEFDAEMGIKGNFLEGQVVEYAFTTSNKTAMVVLHGVDDKDVDFSIEFEITIVDSSSTNVPPISVIQMTGNGLNVSFSGLSSFDPNGKITSYTWTFSDGSTGTGPMVNKSFTSAGIYIATLKVVDNEGLTGTTTSSITIDFVSPPIIKQYVNQTVINNVTGNNPPTATASFTIKTSPKGQVDFIGTGTDSDGSIVKYEWDFDGDGTWDYNQPTTGTTSHNYEKPGFYVALFRVTDNNGTSTIRTLSIGIRTDEIGTKASVRESGASLSTLLPVLIISIIVAVAIAAAVGYVMSKKVAVIKKDEAAEQEVAEIKKLVEESKATGANIDEAEALIRQFDGR